MGCQAITKRLVGLLLLLWSALAAAVTPAHFRVTEQVIQADLQPFTATINGFGNSLIPSGGGFEPVVFRSRITASQDAVDRVVAAPEAISHWDTLREGALDGAEVRVYRISNGRFQLVRSDRIAAGGFHASGWQSVLAEGVVLPRDSRRFQFRWQSWNRPAADYYFTVRAIDWSGNLSPPAEAAAVKSPRQIVDRSLEKVEVSYRKSMLTWDSTPPAAPTQLRGQVGLDGTLQLEWQAADERDLAGFLVYRSDEPPSRQQGHSLQLEGRAASAEQQIRQGDQILLSKKFYAPSRQQFHTQRIWGAEQETQLLRQPLLDFFPDEDVRKRWQLVQHDPSTVVEQPGETFLQLTLGFGDKAIVGLYNHSGAGQNWYPVLQQKPYRVEAWLRKEGLGQVRFVREGSGGTSTTPLRADEQWRRHVSRFTPSQVEQGDTPYRMYLELTGPGTFSLDNFHIYREDSPFLELLPEDRQRLRDSGMAALRTHGLIKTGRRSYDLQQLTNPGGVISGSEQGNTLPQTLTALRQVGVRPWLQIEPHLSPEEWLGLLEYLAAPFDPAQDKPADRPWAFKRHQQGQSEPWLQSFDRLYLELGNETWNGLFQPWVFEPMRDAVTGQQYSAGEVCGLYQEYVIGLLRRSPYWNAAVAQRLRFVLGGWADQGYGRDAAKRSPSSHWMTIAAYNGGWDEAEGPPDGSDRSLFNVLNQVNQTAMPVAERHRAEVNGSMSLGTYEAGPGYVMNGLNGAEVSRAQTEVQEQVMKSLAAGTATLDAFLARASRGFSLQNFFTFGAGDYWRSHAQWYHGGQAYPAWQLLSLFNRQGRGDLLDCQALQVPTADLTGFDRRKTIKDAPQVACYATRQGNRYKLFLLSRRLANYPQPGDDGYTPLQVELPFKTARSLTLYRMLGDPRAHNLRQQQVKLERLELPTNGIQGSLILNAATGADPRGLPPATTLLYVFERVE